MKLRLTSQLNRSISMRIFSKSSNFMSRVKVNDISPLTSDLLKGLFVCLNTPGSEENEYVMKAIMRSFGILQEVIVPFLADLLPKLTEKLAVVSKNPSRPNFNHYLFETFALSIK